MGAFEDRKAVSYICTLSATYSKETRLEIFFLSFHLFVSNCGPSTPLNHMKAKAGSWYRCLSSAWLGAVNPDGVGDVFGAAVGWT